MATKVGELFVSLVVDAASGNLSVRQLISALGELDVVSVGTAGMIEKVGEKLYGMAKSATDAADELFELNELTGEDPKIVQQWDKAAERITHHTGVIIGAIKSVSKINIDLARGGGAPQSLTGLFRTSPYKTVNGETVAKDAFDYLKEWAAKGSAYRNLSREQQRGGLSDIFGGNGDQIYLTLKALIEGRLKPGEISGMNDQQVKDLREVRDKEIKISQQLTDIFQHLLTGGGEFAKVLDSISKKLGIVDKWMEGPGAAKLWKDAKSAVPTVAGELFKPFAMVLDAKNMIAAALEGNTNRQLREQNREGVGELRGKLDISLVQNGKPIGTKTAWIDKAGTMRDFWSVTDQMGNTP